MVYIMEEWCDNAKRRAGGAGNSATNRRESLENSPRSHMGALHCILVGGADVGGTGWRMVRIKQQSCSRSIRGFLGCMGEIVARYSPYYAISLAAVIGAMIVGGALSSAADHMKEEAYQDGRGDIMRTVPVHYLTEVRV